MTRAATLWLGVAIVVVALVFAEREVARRRAARAGARPETVDMKAVEKKVRDVLKARF